MNMKERRPDKYRGGHCEIGTPSLRGIFWLQHKRLHDGCEYET